MRVVKTMLLGFLLGWVSWAQSPGELIVSSQPSGPSQTSFHSGDSIYARAYYQAPLTRLPITRRVTLSLKIFERVGGAESFLDYYNIGLSGKAMEALTLPLELAPDVDRCTSYTDPDLTFKTFGKRLDGPAAMCEILGRLGSGRHELVLRLEQDGVLLAMGVLVLEGNDFTSYANREARLKKRFWPAK